MRPDIAPLAARELAIELLVGSPRRLSHTLAVATHCDLVARRANLRSALRDIVVSAGYLHDIGYALASSQTGFHPLDGARYLGERGWPFLARLVAHHSQAHLQAALLGLSLEEFPRVRGLTADILDYADIRTGPDGQLVTAEERLREIAARYNPNSSTATVLAQRRPLMEAVVQRVERRCGGDPLV